MKKLIFIFILIIFIFSICLINFNKSYNVIAIAELNNTVIDRNGYINNTEYNDLNKEYANSYYSYIYLYEFQKLHPNRTSGTNKEKDAADYLAAKFKLLGLTGYDQDKYIKNFSSKSADDSNIDSYNVIGIKKANIETDKQIIISSCFDNAYDNYLTEDNTSAEGAYKSGTGIATLLTLIESVKNKSFDFNIIFVAFGANEKGNLGSLNYVSKMTKNEIDNTLLMINLERISGGDDLYLYCDEFKTEHENYIYDNISSDLKLNKVPKDKNIAMSPSMQNPSVQQKNYYPYFHNGLVGDHVPFLLKGINCAYFFSCYWGENSPIGKESTDHSDINYTEKDNLVNLENFYGSDIYKRMDNLSSNLITVLEKADFSSSMQLSKESKKNYYFLLNYKVINIFYYVIKITFALIIIIIAFRLNKLRHGAGNKNDNNYNDDSDKVFKTEIKKDESVFKDFDI